MDRPILFSAPMVRALLAGTKTQTRRTIPLAVQLAYDDYDDWCSNVSAGVPTTRQWEEEFFRERSRIKAGDTLWVREAWRTFAGMDNTKPRDLWTPGCGHGAGILYEADCDGLALTKEGERWTGTRAEHRNAFGKLRPSMFMPRWASRMTLTVTDVRVQRLQDITEEDAIAEGYPPPDKRAHSGVAEIRDAYPIAWYSWLWDSINGAGAWAANPWVTATTFAVERRNIDAEG